jgi:hypothetical protein
MRPHRPILAAVALTALGACHRDDVRFCSPCNLRVSTVDVASTPLTYRFEQPIDVLASLTAPAAAPECRACSKSSVKLDPARVCDPIRTQAEALMRCYCDNKISGARQVTLEFDIASSPRAEDVRVTVTPVDDALGQCVERLLQSTSFCASPARTVHAILPVSFDGMLRDQCPESGD